MLNRIVRALIVVYIAVSVDLLIFLTDRAHGNIWTLIASIAVIVLMELYAETSKKTGRSIFSALSKNSDQVLVSHQARMIQVTLIVILLLGLVYWAEIRFDLAWLSVRGR